MNPARIGGPQDLENSGAAYNDRSLLKPAMNTAQNHHKTSNYLQDILI
jgi:hypothetical protein